MAFKSARARRLGLALRQYRETAGLTLEVAADEINTTKSTLSRYETGQTPVAPATVRGLMLLYGIDGDEMAAMIQLAREARQRGWWQAYDGVLDRPLLDIIALEDEATAISTFEPSLIPGLLQTADYIRAVMRGAPYTLEDQEVEQRVEARLKRQKRLAGKNPPFVHAIMDEAALRRPVGEPEVVMPRQIAHLLKAADQRNVTLQVLPLSVGYHRGTGGSLHILEFADPSDPLVASLDTVAGHLILDRPADIRTCSRVMEHLRTVALSPSDTHAMLTALLERHS